MNKSKRIIIFLIASMMTSALQLTAQTFYHTGNEEPVETNHLPGIVLAGGAGDNNDAMQWMLERADGGDVVVLRASGSDLYNDYFYSDLGVEVNSVTSIVITSSDQANNSEVISALSNAEVVFIAGGNQWNYVDNWRDTQLLETLNFLVNDKQITIGGTSAGMAVLGEVVFTAENATVWSSEALSNPYHWRVKLEKDFLDIPHLNNTVTDSHYNRIEGGTDRKGRHIAFMARMVADWGMPARGIAANEYTAIAVDEDGKARVFGHPSYDDYGYFLQKHAGPPEVCEEGEPLTWYQDQQAVKIYKVKGDFQGSGWFDISNWEDGEGGEWQFWYVDEGVLYEPDTDDDDTSVVGNDLAGLEIYPNPASDFIRIKSVLGITETALIRLDGKIMLRKEGNGVNETMLKINHLPPGSYLLRVLEGDRYHTRPVTIVR